MRRASNRWLYYVGIVYAVGVYMYLLLPNVVVGVMSFNRDRFSSWPVEEWTVGWWRSMWANPAIWSAFRTTLLIGIGVALLSCVLGTVTAVGIVRIGGVASRVIVLIMITILVIPPLVYGSALVSASNMFGVRLGLPVVVIGHLMLAVPYTTLTVAARLRTIDADLEEAAATLGATPRYTLRHVTLPLLGPALVAGAALAFAVSFDEFNVTIFTIGLRHTTLPLYVFSQSRLGISPELNALATITILSSMVVLVWAYRGQLKSGSSLLAGAEPLRDGRRAKQNVS